jgi:phospholipid N-methyltransferase
MKEDQRITGPKFFREFLRDRHVAALRPSSHHLIRRLLRHVDATRTATVVELGPGSGVATRPLLRHLGADARYVAIERNPRFAAVLEKEDDPRLEIVRGDARNMAALLDQTGLDSADAVIASIPFTYLDNESRERLVRDVATLLAPEGIFVIFHQHTPLMAPYLKRRFREVRTEFEPRNFLPCFLITARRPEAP